MKVEIYVRPKLVEYMPTTKLIDFKTKKKKNQESKTHHAKTIFSISFSDYQDFIDQKQYSSIQKHIQLHDSNLFFFTDKLRCMDYMNLISYNIWIMNPRPHLLSFVIIFLAGKLYIHPMGLKSIILSSIQLLWKKKVPIELKLIALYYIIMERYQLTYSTMVQFKTKKPRHLFRPFTWFQRIIEVMNWQLFVSRTNQVVSSVPIFYDQAQSAIGKALLKEECSIKQFSNHRPKV